MAGAGDDADFVVPTKMPKHMWTYSWPEESFFTKSHILKNEDIRTMLKEDYSFMRDTMLLAANKYIGEKEKKAINVASPTMGNTLAVWAYVNNHDGVITGDIFKPAKKVTQAAESKVSKDALKEATKAKQSAILPGPGRADHPSTVVPKAPQQIVMWAQSTGDGTLTHWGTDFCVLLNAMSQAGARIPILTLTKGAYSRMLGEVIPASLTSASGMGMWGLVRTARQEIPNIPMLCVDVAYGMPPADVGRTLLPSDSEQAYYHGVKFCPMMEQVPSLLKKAHNNPNTQGGRPQGSGNKPMFQRKLFSWGRPESKLDNVWWRQRWAAVGPAANELPSKKGPVAA